jgi:hypothetical protein
MHRTTLALAAVSVMLALVTACRRGDGQTAGTTTITSATDTRQLPSGGNDYAADRIAAALCEQQRTCVTAELPDLSAEAASLGEAVCVADLKPKARQGVDTWTCSPAVARAGFEECVAAIKAEARCYEILLTEESPVLACRPSSVCHKGQGITMR